MRSNNQVVLLVGQKKAKLELKETNDKKEAVKLMSDRMDKLIDSQQLMCHHLKKCENEKKLRLLRSKYKQFRRTDRKKARAILKAINIVEDEMMDDLGIYFEGSTGSSENDEGDKNDNYKEDNGENKENDDPNTGEQQVELVEL
jgi:hypothetical protein